MAESGDPVVDGGAEPCEFAGGTFREVGLAVSVLEDDDPCERGGGVEQGPEEPAAEMHRGSVIPAQGRGGVQGRACVLRLAGRSGIELDPVEVHEPALAWV